MAVEVKCTAKESLSLSGSYLRDQLASMLALSKRVPSYYAVRFVMGVWRWFPVEDGMGTILRAGEGLSLEQVEEYK
jgi:hypothetical protein